MSDNVEANLSIDGFPFYIESLSVTESYERRELVRNKIMGGTEYVSEGDWIPKEFTVTTSVDVTPGGHDVHDTVFKNMMSKPCEIICPDMGDIFMAQVIIKKIPVSGAPHVLNLEISIKQIADIINLSSDSTTTSTSYDRMKIS